MNWPETVFRWLAHLRYRSEPTAVSEGEAVEQLADRYGRARVVVEQTVPSGATYTRCRGASQLVAKASAGNLLELWGFNDEASVVYVQLHNASSLPSNGATPLEVLRVPAGGSFSFAPSAPLSFTTGLVIVASSARDTLTHSASAHLTITAAVL